MNFTMCDKKIWFWFSHFIDLFAALESKSTDVSTLAESMGIKSYGVSMTTLEEVFLALGNCVNK